MCSLKQIKIKKQKDPWISNEIFEFINDKNDLLEIVKNTGQEDDWNAARTSRNFVAGMIKNGKRNFLTNEIENDQDPNKF